MLLNALLAHGVGGRSDLPLPVWLFSYGAGSALLISFVTLHILWRQPRLDVMSAGIQAPRALRALSFPFGVAMRTFGLLSFALVFGAAWFGDPSAATNISPVLVYVIFWVGLQGASFMFGDIWSLLSPWMTLGLLVEKLRRSRSRTTSAATQGTNWPAAVGIAAFVWMELCYHDPSSPRVLAVALGVYSLVMVVVTALHGTARLSTADPFGAWFGLLGAMGPVFRDARGSLRVRWPFTGLTQIRPRPGTLALVMVVLGSTAFDGFSRTSWWRDWTANSSGWESTGLATLGLTGSVALVLAIYVVAIDWAGKIGSQTDQDPRGAFLSSLVPIALAYAIGHYFSLFLFEGQQSLALVSDPLGKGWDLFGTIDWSINYQLLTTDAIAWVQVLAIVGGHIAGVVIAHDRAISLFVRTSATKSQVPLLAVMVAYTVGGLGLLLGA